MLATLPAELQTEVFSYLPQRDLRSLVLVSQSVHDAADRQLYVHVELNSLASVEYFFRAFADDRSAPTDDQILTERAQWERIKTLEISTGARDPCRTLEGLPSSLTGPGMAPLRLDRLRLHHHGDVRHLLPLLKCLDPRTVGLCHDSVITDRSFWTLSTLGRWWTNVRHLDYAGDYRFDEYRLDESLAVPSDPSTATTPFVNVKTITLLNLNRKFQPQPGPDEAAEDTHPWSAHAFLQRYCYAVESNKILVVNAEARRAVRKSLRLWSATRPLGFYKIVVIQGRRDKWGDRIEG